MTGATGGATTGGKGGAAAAGAMAGTGSDGAAGAGDSGGTDGAAADGGSGNAGADCTITNCSGSGYTYSCGTPSSSETTDYCIIAGNPRVKTRTRTFTNGHVVTCEFVCGTSSGTCTDDAGATCSFPAP